MRLDLSLSLLDEPVDVAVRQTVRDHLWSGVAPRRSNPVVGFDGDNAIQHAEQPAVPGMVMGQGKGAGLTDLLLGLAVADGSLGRMLQG